MKAVSAFSSYSKSSVEGAAHDVAVLCGRQLHIWLRRDAAHLTGARMTCEGLAARFAGISSANYIAGLTNEKLTGLLLDHEK